MITEIKELLKRVGMLRTYGFLMLLRAPFDVLSTCIYAVFLKEAYYSIEQMNSTRLTITCLIFGVASCILFLYNGIVWRMFGSMYVRLSGKLRKVLIGSIIEQPLSVIEKKTKGDVLTRINQDTGMALQMLGGPLNLPHFVIALLNIVISSMILLPMDAGFLFLVWMFVIPHVLVNQKAVAKPSARYQKEVQLATGELTTVFGCMITAADDMILYDAQALLVNQYKICCDEIYKARMKIVTRNALGSGLIPMFGLLGYLVLIIYGGEQIANQTLQFSDLIGMLQIRGSILLGSLMVTNCCVRLKINATGIKRVNELMDGECDG